jgi:2-oxoglutarate ferredoxin oxidoreductase subunit beta
MIDHERQSVAYDWLRHDKKFPHVGCPGCGLGILLGSMIRAFDRSGLTKDEVALVSGIGCTGRLPVYVDVASIHTTHGRALTFATGIKLGNPKLKVITVMGDGDAMAIGGNHLIHAARRNLDITAVMVNNYTYGMTGGQYSPTTPFGARASTAFYGHIEKPFDLAALCSSAGASFVARTTVYHVNRMDKLLAQAMTKSGFSIVEVMSPCYTNFGRQNRLDSHLSMMKQFKEQGLDVNQWEKLPEHERSNKFPIGVLVDRDMPDYLESFKRLCENAKKLRAAGKI